MAPESITDHRTRGALELGWPDGRSDVVHYHALRLLCPCAHCKQQRAQAVEGRAWHAHIPQDVVVTHLEPVGSYGLQVGFSDGHDRGIFPWVFLRGLLDGGTHGPGTGAG